MVLDGRISCRAMGVYWLMARYLSSGKDVIKLQIICQYREVLFGLLAEIYSARMGGISIL